MKEFENALTAAFGADRAEPADLTIDQLDGRLPGSAAVRASTCVSRAEPVRACGICAGQAEPAGVNLYRAGHAEPVRVCACYCLAEQPDPVAVAAG